MVTWKTNQTHFEFSETLRYGLAPVWKTWGRVLAKLTRRFSQIVYSHCKPHKSWHSGSKLHQPPNATRLFLLRERAWVQGYRASASSLVVYYCKFLIFFILLNHYMLRQQLRLKKNHGASKLCKTSSHVLIDWVRRGLHLRLLQWIQKEYGFNRSQVIPSNHHLGSYQPTDTKVLTLLRKNW